MRVKKKVTKLIIEIQIGEHIDRYRFLTTLTINTTTYYCMYEKKIELNGSSLAVIKTYYKYHAMILK